MKAACHGGQELASYGNYSDASTRALPPFVAFLRRWSEVDHRGGLARLNRDRGGHVDAAHFDHVPGLESRHDRQTFRRLCASALRP